MFLTIRVSVRLFGMVSLLTSDDLSFRRALSGNDIRGKKLCENFRRVLSDATNENSSILYALDGEEICQPKLQYTELVTIAGVSDIPELCSVDSEEKPPPADAYPKLIKSQARSAEIRPAFLP